MLNSVARSGATGRAKQKETSSPGAKRSHDFGFRVGSDSFPIGLLLALPAREQTTGVVLDYGVTTKKNGGRMGKALLLAIMSTAVMSQTALAGERYELEFYDVTPVNGEPLRLKQELRRQHGLNAEDYELVSARLVAKTRAGRGTATLVVGNWRSRAERVNMGDFNDRSPRSFDRVDFYNDSRDSRGVWQFDLQGQFQVRKVVLELDRRGGGGWGYIYEQVRCEGFIKWLTVECRTSGRPVDVRLLQQFSSSPCTKGQTFGIGHDGIWVSKGCRGNFEVTIRR